MKKTYITPSTTSIRLFAENDVAGNGITLISGGMTPQLKMKVKSFQIRKRTLFGEEAKMVCGII